MRNDRIGEHLWDEWDGDLYETASSDPKAIYYTLGHVDLENPIVRRALASAIQRDGVALSLSHAFQMIENSTIQQVWIAYDEICYVVCDEQGETYYGDIFDDIEPSTFIEL